MTTSQIIITVLISIPIFLVLLLVAEGLIAMSGKRPDFVNPSQNSIKISQGAKKLNYVVTGDSTAAGEGADYQKGIAVQTAKKLATDYQITFTNLSISGATTQDVINSQLKQAIILKPNIILISIGANDLTHFTSTRALKNNLKKIVESLIKSNCDIKIVLTGTPDMGAVPRFLQPLRWLAGYQTTIQNQIFDQVIQEYKLTLAPIAKETGPIFRADRSLFAEDSFHPNEKGYALWIPVINQAIDSALASQPSHCN